MLDVVAVPTSGDADPEILTTVASRFQRLSWKHSGMAYATTPRRNGVLCRTMYRVATVTGLAPCGTGIGEANMSVRVLGLDYPEESSVGGFSPGGRPLDDPGMRDGEQGGEWADDPEWSAWASSVLRRT